MRARWVGLAAALLVGVWALYWLFVRLADSGPELEMNRMWLPALSLLLVVLSVALAGVLVRNLVRLIVDRKRGILGSRLRTKLVFFLLALVLLPAAVLFSGSAQVIKLSVEAILRTPLEELPQQSREIVRQWSDYFKHQSSSRARVVAREVAARVESEGGVRFESLEDVLERFRDDSQILRVSVGTRPIAEAHGLDAASRAELAEEVDRLIRQLILDRVELTQSGETPGTVARIDRLGDGLLAYAVEALPPVEGMPHDATVTVATVLPTQLAGNLEGIDKAVQVYKRFRAQRRELVRLYVTMIGVIFLVTLLIATWIGFYLTRRITAPVREMSAAAREISAGNLEVRVSSSTGDEMGTLVDAFNEMASELQENREVITRSTTELRRSNRALEERKAYIETLVSGLSTGVLSLDADERITTANPAASQILGVPFEPGDPMREVFEMHGLEALNDLLEEGREREGGVRRELTLARNQVTTNLSVQVSPLPGRAGEQPGTLVVVEDLTELLRAQKAAAWREIARRIAHEIKNPLTPIQLAAQRVKKKFEDGSPDLARVVTESTAAVEREVAALKQLVDEFSRFARMPEVAPREVDFAEVVESVLSLYRGHARIRWDVQLDPPQQQVRVDPDQMRRVLINLIDNAVAAMTDEGELRVASRHPDGGPLRIEVADSGPGIPPEDRGKMFSPYFSTKKRGTGLGLAIVHKVVTDHLGTIRVEDNQPRGARFVIEIPA